MRPTEDVARVPQHYNGGEDEPSQDPCARLLRQQQLLERNAARTLTWPTDMDGHFFL